MERSEHKLYERTYPALLADSSYFTALAKRAGLNSPLLIRFAQQSESKRQVLI